jgi:predicted O-linked N-acetylglucosamine transferase (SPINDLY family)
MQEPERLEAHVSTDPTDAPRPAAPQHMSILDLIGQAEALRASGKQPKACELYQAWIAHHGDDPSLHAIWFNYAVSLADTNDVTGAVNALRHAILLKPDFYPPYINLGGLLERLGRADSAVATWSRLVGSLSAVTGDTVAWKLAALKQIGRVLEVSHVPAAAEAALAQCLEINADQPEAIQHYIAIRQGQCKWPTLANAGRITKQELIGAISPLSTACYTDDPIFQLANAARYNRRSVGSPPAPRTALDGVAIPPRSPDRLRIGYVSSDFRNHAVGFAMTDVVETHDHDHFEIFAYYCGIRTRDDTQDRIRAAADHWIDLTDVDDTQAARQVRANGIDILVDLNGYTKDARTRMFALRPAPIAVNWFGFPHTMGSPYHHYIIADDIVIPHGSELYYSESVARVPCYQANDRRRVVAATPTRQEAGLPEVGFVFCCLNGMQKITESTFRRWLVILHEVPDSVLWLLGGTAETQQRLRRTAEQLGVAGHRLVFAEKRMNPEHLARFRLADLFLDSFPYGAHTTASDALWMGVPVVTLRGRSFAARVCASLVSAAGLPELVCDTPEHYIQLAIALGRDQERLARLRMRLVAGRDTCTLFDTSLLVCNLEARYRDMHDAFRRGMLPHPDLTNLDVYHEAGASLDPESLGQLDDPSYRDLYRDRLAEIDAVFPVQPDSRFWRKPD